MGTVYKPRDAKKRGKVDKALEDLDPNTRDAAKKANEEQQRERPKKKSK